MPEVVDIPKAVIEADASWYDRFKNPPGPTTNFVLQARRNQNKLAHVQLLQDERALREMERVKTDRVAQSAHFRQQDFEAAQEKSAQLMEHRAERHDHALKLDKVQLRVAIAKERALAAATEAKEELNERIANDTALFSERATEAMKTHRPGTPEYARAVAEARLQAPAADKAVFDDIWKSTNSDLPPEQVIENFKKVQSLASTATVSATATGGTTITQRPGAETAPLERERDFLLGLREKSKARLAKEDDPTKHALHKADLEEYEQKLSETTARLEAARQPKAASTPAGTPADDRVAVISPDGKRGRIPRGQLEAALAAGYKNVQ